MLEVQFHLMYHQSCSSLGWDHISPDIMPTGATGRSSPLSSHLALCERGGDVSASYPERRQQKHGLWKTRSSMVCGVSKAARWGNIGSRLLNFYGIKSNHRAVSLGQQEMEHYF